MVHNFYQIGGGEHTVFENEVNLLRNHGHKVFLYTRNNDELKTSKVKLLLSPFSTLWSFKTYREVKNLIKKKRIDIVHCHNTFPLISPSVYYAARKCGVPVIQTIHNFRFLCPNGSFYCNGHICEVCNEKCNFKNALKNRCYRNSLIQTFVVVTMLKLHRVLGTYRKINYIFLTEFNKRKFDKLIDINGANVFVKPNFVNDISKIERSVIDKTFVFAGRLDENKGIKLLLERWKTLPEDYCLHIYGNGNLEDEVRKISNKEKNIVYLGFKPQTVIFSDISHAIALAFPSTWYEGFPMIIAESMALGCPILATDIGNQADILKESKGGVLFNPKSVESFNSAIEKIISENEKLSRNAQNYYKNYLNREKGYISLENIYDQSVKRGGANSK